MAIDRLRDALVGLTDASAGVDEDQVLSSGIEVVRTLVSVDDWLPEEMAVASRERYCQYLLYRDPADAFSVVSFVWGPGQRTPIHDHGVWGIVGVLRGVEISQRYDMISAGSVTRLVQIGEPVRHHPGDVDVVSPSRGDIHWVANDTDEIAISIHVYGTDIGSHQRHTYTTDGAQRQFVSGYSNPAPYLV